ncbi:MULTISPECIES: histidine kinase [unclassified Spirosoma]|uniref:sensor histidine kinase n=1 Tax=unclassified Spirosoma TaxID=2621999 RepID=UPI00095F2F0B|nr:MULTISPECIES: histidine kinase [unclassified Spirosoma]MBN8823936.1 histidine kinase [Spirosoma sp.]OJW79672.1 MAG: histidine kinase [Spirosoma sp. 48-14]
MTYEAWSPLFLGMVLAMLLANSVQWFMYRERIYGIYSVYTLIWAVYFTINHFSLPYNISNFYKLILSYSGYILYLELAKIFLNLKDRPRFLRWVIIVQGLLVAYCVVKTYIYLFTDFWQTKLHTILLQPVRFALLSVGAYIVYSFFRSKDVVARFFVAGTASLLVNHAITTILLIHSPNISVDLPFWQHPDLFIQTGVVLDLIFFSLGISYRHRREAVNKAVVEKELEREREQHHREFLEADLALQKMQQEKTEMQMRALQSQINPHFLFNGLNTLSSLIDENPGQAGEFVDELSKVYRYLLRSNDAELTTLGVELSFISSYFHLLKTRFGSSVRLDVDVNESYKDSLLPPLTLQLLVENAVKHNVVLRQTPLHIRIRTTTEQQLVVENTLQRKTIRVESNGVGLSNIADKYKLLNQPAPRIEEQNGWFQVTLPLLMPQSVMANIATEL